MPSARLGILMGAVMGFGYGLVIHGYAWAQDYWGAKLRATGNFTGWWFVSALALAALTTIIVGTFWVLSRTWLKVRNRLLLISASLDLLLAVVLWFLGAAMNDPTTKHQLAGVGLAHCTDLLLSAGTAWVAVTFIRLAVGVAQIEQRPETEGPGPQKRMAA